MSAGYNIKFDKSDFKELKKMQREHPAAFKKALEKGAIQLMTWMNDGSPREDRTPPIRWGILRGSASAFVGNKFVGVAPSTARGVPTPAKSYEAPSPMRVTIIYNTNYAARMHEWKGGWGEKTIQAGNAGNKWIEKHLIADKDAFMEVVAEAFKKEAKLDSA